MKPDKIQGIILLIRAFFYLAGYSLLYTFLTYPDIGSIWISEIGTIIVYLTGISMAIMLIVCATLMKKPKEVK